MRPILVRGAAECEVDEIAARIAKQNLSAAIRFYQRVEETFERLAAWPNCGRPRLTRNPLLQGRRTYPIRVYRNYLVFFIAYEDRVEILHGIHGARDNPAVLRL